MTTTINNEHKKLNVPNLRFKEFQGEWEKYTLEDVMNFSTTRINSSELNEDNYVSTENMLQDYQGIVDAKSVPEDVNVISFSCGDILISNIRPYLKKVWKATYNGGCSSDVFVLKANDNIESDYLHYVIANDKFINFVMSGAKGVKMPRGDKNQMKTYSLSLPKIQEQKKIGKILSLLDERITTQNKIIDKLRSLIKGICNNYFEKLSVQEKANLIRLSDVLKERNEYSSKDGKFIHGTLSKDGIFPKTGRWDRDFLVKQEDKKYKVTHLDDICYNPANLKFGVICRNTFGDLIFSPIYVTFEVCKNVNIGFMELYLTNHNFIEKVRRFEQGTVYERMAVSPEDFLSYKIRIPSYPDQTFFYKKVQWLITLSQNEMKLLSQYKKLRQYLLRQMFI